MRLPLRARASVRASRVLIALLLLGGWVFSGWPNIFDFPPGIRPALALNQTANWNFNGNSTGWTATNGTANASTAGTPGCGNTSDNATTNMTTFVYAGALSGQTAFEAISGATKNKDYRGNIHQTITAPGSGTVKAKGKFSYYGNSTAWGAGMVSLELWDSANTTYVASLGCIALSANTSWTTASFSSDASLTGGTTYTIRVNLVAKTKSNSNTAITLGVDNVVVNLAPTGLGISAPAGTTNVQLNWTASTAGSGANGLHATTPYKVYRDTSSPVSTFLANDATTAYTDTTTAGNTAYFYAISDVDTASDESPLSAEVSLLTLPAVPGTPTFTNVAPSALTVNWTAPAGGADSYRIERCQGSGCSGFSEIASGVTGLSYDDSGLSDSTLYRYRIRATNATGDGDYSSIGETTTGAVTVSVTVGDGVIAYGFIAAGGSKSTSTGVWDTQTATNTGNVAEDFSIQGTDSADWTLAASAGSEQYSHAFCTASCASPPTNYAALTTGGTSLASNITAGAAQAFDLNIAVPTSTSHYGSENVDVTIIATQH